MTSNITIAPWQVLLVPTGEYVSMLGYQDRFMFAVQTGTIELISPCVHFLEKFMFFADVFSCPFARQGSVIDTVGPNETIGEMEFILGSSNVLTSRVCPF